MKAAAAETEGTDDRCTPRWKSNQGSNQVMTPQSVGTKLSPTLVMDIGHKQVLFFSCFALLQSSNFYIYIYILGGGVIYYL